MTLQKQCGQPSDAQRVRTAMALSMGVLASQSGQLKRSFARP